MQERKRVRKGAPNVERIQFYARIDDRGCWRWTGGIDGSGYGIIRTVSGLTQKAHRVAYEAWVGPIPDGLQLDHLCRVRSCCNPEHLEPVTPRENSLRGETVAARHASATHCPQRHEYTPENIYTSKRGERDCRVCRRVRSREWARRRRLQLAAAA